jgi:hypothetical protein
VRGILSGNADVGFDGIDAPADAASVVQNGYVAGRIEATVANSSGTFAGEISGAVIGGAGSGAGDGLSGMIVGAMTGGYGGIVSGTVPTNALGNGVWWALLPAAGNQVGHCRESGAGAAVGVAVAVGIYYYQHR